MLRLSYDSAGNVLVSNLIYASNHITHALKYTERQSNLLLKSILSAKVVLQSAIHMLACNLIFIRFYKTNVLDICRKSIETLPKKYRTSIKFAPKKCQGDP